jgi:hypothetical protein
MIRHDYVGSKVESSSEDADRRWEQIGAGEEVGGRDHPQRGDDCQVLTLGWMPTSARTSKSIRVVFLHSCSGRIGSGNQRI